MCCCNTGGATGIQFEDEDGNPVYTQRYDNDEYTLVRIRRYGGYDGPQVTFVVRPIEDDG